MSAALVTGLAGLLIGFACGLLLSVGLARAEKRARRGRDD